MPAVRRMLLLVLIALTAAPVPVAHAAPRAGLQTATVTASVQRVLQRSLPFPARHVAVYWQGQPDAQVTVAFSRNGVDFGPALGVGRDEVGEQRNDGRTYGRLLPAAGATAVQVRTDKAIKRLTVLGLRDRIRGLVAPLLPDSPSPDKAPMPSIQSRAQWGADESLRFRSDGSEKWTPKFAPIQKLIVHHTDTANNDGNPAGTVRAIYYYHAVTQGWGDIGYNFLIDASGRIYKGRVSHPPNSNTDTINGKDAQGRGVIGAHALGHNTGTVGVALLGTLTDRDATPAARQALERLLAWEADAHGIDPYGSSPYTSSSGAQETFPNIAGHRDTGRQTQCPGETFHRTLPQLRAAVAARMGAS